MDTMFQRLQDTFNADKLVLWFGKIVPSLLAAILTFVVFWVFWKIVERGLRVMFARSTLDATARSFLQTVLKYVIITIGTVSALSELGINTGSVLASLGVAGLTIGFAAKDALSNLISGIFIFWDRPFVIGDLVEIAGSYGRVETITMRSTRVVTPDGKMLAIPNSTIVNGTVVSYTNFPHLRLDIGLTVGLNEDYEHVRGIMLDVMKSYPGTLTEPAATVVIESVNDFNVGVQARVWIGDEKQHIAMRFGLREKLYLALRDAGVDMPLETIQLAPMRVETMPVLTSHG